MIVAAIQFTLGQSPCLSVEVYDADSNSSNDQTDDRDMTVSTSIEEATKRGRSSLFPAGDEKGTQPILFGTDVACMRIVSDAELIGESLDAGTWLCGEIRFSLGRGVVFRSAQQRTARHDRTRGSLLFRRS